MCDGLIERCKTCHKKSAICICLPRQCEILRIAIGVPFGLFGWYFGDGRSDGGGDCDLSVCVSPLQPLQHLGRCKQQDLSNL